MRESVGTCILHPVLVLFPRLIALILLLFHLFLVSIIVISIIYYDISGCSYSYSSTRIFISHASVHTLVSICHTVSYKSDMHLTFLFMDFSTLLPIIVSLFYYVVQSLSLVFSH